jgi:hypothetical protein
MYGRRPPLYPPHGARFAHQATTTADHEAGSRLVHDRLGIQGPWIAAGTRSSSSSEQLHWQLQQSALQQLHNMDHDDDL